MTESEAWQGPLVASGAPAPRSSAKLALSSLSHVGQARQFSLGTDSFARLGPAQGLALRGVVAGDAPPTSPGPVPVWAAHPCLRPPPHLLSLSSVTADTWAGPS